MNKVADILQVDYFHNVNRNKAVDSNHPVVKLITVTGDSNKPANYW